MKSHKTICPFEAASWSIFLVTDFLLFALFLEGCSSGSGGPKAPVRARPIPKIVIPPGPHGPARVTPQPPPAPAPSRAVALAKLNALRASAVPHAGPLTEDARLAKSAQYHATRLAQGFDRPHDNLVWRIWTYAGFPHGQCGIRNSGFGNASEGVAEGSGAIDLATLIGALDGDAPHRADLTDPAYRLVGIGVATSPDGLTWVVVDYGVDCGKTP